MLEYALSFQPSLMLVTFSCFTPIYSFSHFTSGKSKHMSMWCSISSYLYMMTLLRAKKHTHKLLTIALLSHPLQDNVKPDSCFHNYIECYILFIQHKKVRTFEQNNSQFQNSKLIMNH